jgi:SAM-dependent methyltransferase
MEVLQKRTASSFGFEWSKFKGIYDSYGQNLLSSIEPLHKDFFKDKLVLDAGCGAGRNSWFAAQWGAKKVVGFDLSEKAVKVAQDNLKGLNAEIMQGDIYTFEYPKKFDYCVCIGVLHHLPNPQEGFNHLVSLLDEGGAISIWVYSKEDNWLAMNIYEPLRKITTRLPHKFLYYLSYLPALAVEACNRFDLPLFKHYKVFPFRTKLNDAFDVFSAPSAKYYSIRDILKWFLDADLQGVRVSNRMLNGKVKGIKGMGFKYGVIQ